MPKRKPPDAQLAMAGVVTAPDDEKSYERLIRNRADRWGWMVMKIGKTPVVSKGRKYWITATSIPWPDLSLVHPFGAVLFLEVKGKNGRPSEQQVAIIQGMQRAGLDAFIVYPRDWPAVERMLAKPASQADTTDVQPTPSQEATT